MRSAALRGLAAGTALGAALTLAAPARAQDTVSGDELVETNGGAVYRGALVEKVPGDHVTIRVGAEVRRFAWSDVKSAREVAAPPREVQFLRRDGSIAPPPPPVAPVAPAAPIGAPAAQATAADNRVTVHLQADDPEARLERQAYTAPFVFGGSVGGNGAIGVGVVDTWEIGCRAPCVTRLDPGATYRVAGPGITPSAPFRINSSERPQDIRANTGSMGALVGGTTLATIGGTAAVAGVTLLLVDPALSDGSGTSTTVRTASWLGIGIGGAALIGGLVLAYTKGVTSIDGPTPRSDGSAKVHLTPQGFTF